MRQLAACGGVGALGVGDGCSAQWDAARASGLADRYFLREGAFSIPERIAAAAAKPLGADRTRDLLTALATAHAAQAALEQRLAGQHSNDPLAMMLVGADLEQALICDASDLAAGRRRGAPYDPAATPPEGP